MQLTDSHPLLRIQRCVDIGPATKIIPTVAMFDDPHTILISVDDDIDYRTNFIETLLKYHRKVPDAVVTGESFMRVESTDPSVKYAELVEGYSAVLYLQWHLADFHVETDLDQLPKECYYADDFILSNYLRKNGVKIIVADEPAANKTTQRIYLDYGNGTDALRNGANGNTNGNLDNYRKCSRYLESKKELFVGYFSS